MKPTESVNLRSLLRRSMFAAGIVLGLVLTMGFLSINQCPLYRKPASPKPNIIFILADDLGYGDLGCYGQDKIKTPSLDKMAIEGIRFTDVYSGCSLCAPARCSLMTGYHMGHAYIRSNSSPVFQSDNNDDIPLRPEDTTVSEILKTAGYRTGMIGKWGLGNAKTTGSPNRKGFDYSFGFLDHADIEGGYFPKSLWRNGVKVTVPTGSYQQELFTQDALDFIRNEHEDPFFLYLAYMIPHSPYEVPSDEPYEQEQWPGDMKARAAMITRMDRDVGRILKLLKNLGIDQQTIVFFSSDNGPVNADFFRSAGALSGGKRSLNEGGIRVPMIVRWPAGIQAGQVSEQAWAFWDFLPTAADIAGASPPANLDGISVLPVLQGREQNMQRLLYWERYPRRADGFKQAARLGQWKAIREDSWKKAKSRKKKVTTTFELYNLESDVGEQVDLASQQLPIAQEMQKAMKDSHTESIWWSSTPPPGKKNRGERLIGGTDF